jgi:hypothetical protein
MRGSDMSWLRSSLFERKATLKKETVLEITNGTETARYKVTGIEIAGKVKILKLEAVNASEMGEKKERNEEPKRNAFPIIS